MSKEFRPAEYFDTREYVTDELEARNRTLADCPEIVRLWWASIEPMTTEVAHALAKFLDTDGMADSWMALDRVWESRPQ